MTGTIGVNSACIEGSDGSGGSDGSDGSRTCGGTMPWPDTGHETLMHVAARVPNVALARKLLAMQVNTRIYILNACNGNIFKSNSEPHTMYL